jgi:hypothetical protein
MWATKNKNRPVSGFYTKIAYFQVVNFIPVKVSTLDNIVGDPTARFLRTSVF